MSRSRDQMAGWLDDHLQAVDSHRGAVETVVQLRTYFADALEFRTYTATNRRMSAPMSRGRQLEAL